MPTYAYRCRKCGEVEGWKSIHVGPGNVCPECGGLAANILSVPVVISPETRYTNHRDQELSKDLDAYKRLRQSGMQPPHVDGSATLELAETRLEVESGRLMPAEERARIAEGKRRASDMREWIDSPAGMKVLNADV